jgi:hypothetical protein
MRLPSLICGDRTVINGHRSSVKLVTDVLGALRVDASLHTRGWFTNCHAWDPEKFSCSLRTIRKALVWFA